MRLRGITGNPCILNCQNKQSVNYQKCSLLFRTINQLHNMTVLWVLMLKELKDKQLNKLKRKKILLKMKVKSNRYLLRMIFNLT